MRATQNGRGSSLHSPGAMAKGGKGRGRWDVALSGAHAFPFALIPHGDSIP